MKKVKKPKTITIIGYLWRDRVNGNTYHRAAILINGEPVHTVPYQYGYGTMYVYSAARWLNENGFVQQESDNEPLWSTCRRLGINLYYWTCGLRSKKDLMDVAPIEFVPLPINK